MDQPEAAVPSNEKEITNADSEAGAASGPALRALLDEWRRWLAQQDPATASPFSAGAIQATCICADELEAVLAARPGDPEAGR